MRRMQNGLPRWLRRRLHEILQTSFDGYEQLVEWFGSTRGRARLEKGVEDTAGAAKGGERVSASFGRGGGGETVHRFGEASEGDADELRRVGRKSARRLLEEWRRLTSSEAGP